LARTHSAIDVLGAFAKLRKATVRLPVRMRQLGSHPTDFHEI